MKTETRRWILGVGAAMLVGGWGLMNFAEEQQQCVEMGAGRMKMWREGIGEITSSRPLFAAGVASLALGAGWIGFGCLRGSADSARRE